LKIPLILSRIPVFLTGAAAAGAAAAQTWNANTGNLVVHSNVDNGGNTLTVTGATSALNGN